MSAAVEGTLGLGDRRARVQIGLTTDFPARLPIITVNPHGEFAELPHVEPDGAVCFRPRDEPLLNHDDPYGIVREALQLAAETLYAGLYGNRAAEFANEIVAYWRAYYPKAATVMGVLTPDDRARLVTAFFDCGVRCAVGDTPASFAAFRQFRNVDKLTFVNAVYVPINPAASDPQFHPRHLATAHGLNVHVTPVLRQDQDLWRSIEQHCRAREVLVVLGVQRPSGRRGLVGLIVRRREGAHPFDAQAIDDSRIAPCYVDPVDRAYLLPRGGANTDLGRCRVLVVGCGAVGGYVAMNLARAGLGTIDLMDPDSFEAANTFRHACGRAYVDYRKVVGLKLEIERLLPFVKVRTHQTDVLAWMREQPEGFRAYDLIVLAIGNPTVELRVNAVIAADPKAPPAIFTWLEPLGLGGHALVTHIGASSAGCFQCLYERGEDGTLVCRAAYAHPGGRYTRDMMGCGSQHMSFGDLDAQRAAMVVARRALDVLQGNLSESELVSWKGNADAFRAAGFKTTECYERSPPEERLPGLMLVRTGCPLCKPA
ncbi:MAG TPA: ThiF family adenylyltransferase [Polyangiaceae bacterium]|nr:ThiF family adenylyltransferase [Polyangiaceae bacterium]